MLRLLFIEDEPSSVESAVNRLGKGGHECTIIGFSQAESTISTMKPDMVILDLLEGGPTPEPEVRGREVYDFIWRNRFCPIVVYSAQPDALAGGPHPFVQVVQKGSGSDIRLESVVGELRPHVDALRDVEVQIYREFTLALREVAPHAFRVFPDSVRRNDAILRSGRRRLAALMDDLTRHGQTLASWEQYLCPPVNDNIQLGDVIHERGRGHDAPETFRIVLTPSCDLVASGGREPKVSNVLVARCYILREGLRLTSLGVASAKTLLGRLPSILTQGYFETIMFFPKFEGKIPHMAASLRSLELVPLDQIGTEECKFERIASIDSPFRELVAWAYLQVACRPGLPDRNFKEWSREIISSC
jgi:hypothetical protein